MLSPPTTTDEKDFEMLLSRRSSISEEGFITTKGYGRIGFWWYKKPLAILASRTRRDAAGVLYLKTPILPYPLPYFCPILFLVLSEGLLGKDDRRTPSSYVI